MNTEDIYRRTKLGDEEVTGRKATLSQHARQVLMLSDGLRSAGRLAQLFRDPNDADAAFAHLMELGLIELGSASKTNVGNAAGPRPASTHANDTPGSAPPANSAAALTNRAYDSESQRDSAKRFIDGQKYMNNVVREQLGFKAVFFTLKIERCGNTADLIALIPEFEAAIAKAMKSDIGAAAVRKKAEHILSG